MAVLHVVSFSSCRSRNRCYVLLFFACVLAPISNYVCWYCNTCTCARACVAFCVLWRVSELQKWISGVRHVGAIKIFLPVLCPPCGGKLRRWVRYLSSEACIRSNSNDEIKVTRCSAKLHPFLKIGISSIVELRRRFKFKFE